MVAELVEIGELDDERFAHAFAADKRDLSGWGATGSRRPLIDRGIGAGARRARRRGAARGELERAVELVRGKGEDLADERATGARLSRT